jgi:hypothetical protein
MSSNNPRNGKDLLGVARHGLSSGTVDRIRPGKGSHAVVYPANKSFAPIIIPNHNSTPPGTLGAIVKQLVKAGILAVLFPMLGFGIYLIILGIGIL